MMRESSKLDSKVMFFSEEPSQEAEVFDPVKIAMSMSREDVLNPVLALSTMEK